MLSNRRVRSTSVMKVLVVFVLLLCIQSAFGQTRPLISEVFESAAIQITSGTVVSEGVANLIVDQPDGKARQLFAFHSGPAYEIITRYDLGEIFLIDRPECDVTPPVTVTMPTMWGWVAQATFAGPMVIDHITVDVWKYTAGGVALTVAVRAEDANTPVFFERTTSTESFTLHFLNWRTDKPDPNLFNVHSFCLQ